jgi:hypothetical protein
MLIGSAVSLAVLASAAFVFFTISKLIGGLGGSEASPQTAESRHRRDWRIFATSLRGP